MKEKRLKIEHPPLGLAIEAQDWRDALPAELLWMQQQMLVIRRFEEALLELKDADLINGPVHSSIGQEAVAAGVATALRAQDWVTGSHRAHHQYLAKVLCAEAGAGFNPLEQDVSENMREAVRVLLCEIMGLAEGCSGGRGGSMHLIQAAAGVAGTNAIVSGGVPHATGVAWASKLRGEDAVTVCFFGDGGVYQGVTHEAMNLAGIWQAPAIYFIENNRYAVATCADDACSAHRLVDIAAAYGMPGFRLDGMDPLAVLNGMRRIVADRDNGSLPCCVEADVYRHFHHAGALPGSRFGYRSSEEEEQWSRRDPIQSTERRLRKLGLLDDDGAKRLTEQAETCVREAVAYCTQEREAGVRIVRDELYPDPAGMAAGLRDAAFLDNVKTVEAEDLAHDQEIKFSDAIAAVTGRWLEKDPGVVVLGEEVANFGGGAYGATKGLPALYPERILNTPISEAGFCGLACGAALNGMHPVVEIMFSSFALVAADQLFNQIGQIGHIYGGNASVPLVVRTRLAIGLGYGAQHSMEPTALYALFPGWRILVPSTPFDYIGMFNAAMRSRTPTILLEHQALYGQKGMIPADNRDYVVHPGVARVRREGADVTAVSYGWSLNLVIDAATKLAAEGVQVEIVELRSVDDASLDYAAIGRSLERTGMLVTVEQGMRCNSIGSKIVRECQERFFDQLDGPCLCVNAPDVPLPVSRKLEQACIPTVAQIQEALRAAARRKV